MLFVSALNNLTVIPDNLSSSSSNFPFLFESFHTNPPIEYLKISSSGSSSEPSSGFSTGNIVFLIIFDVITCSPQYSYAIFRLLDTSVFSLTSPAFNFNVTLTSSPTGINKVIAKLGTVLSSTPLGAIFLGISTEFVFLTSFPSLSPSLYS